MQTPVGKISKAGTGKPKTAPPAKVSILLFCSNAEACDAEETQPTRLDASKVSIKYHFVVSGICLNAAGRSWEARKEGASSKGFNPIILFEWEACDAKEKQPTTLAASKVSIKDHFVVSGICLNAGYQWEAGRS